MRAERHRRPRGYPAGHNGSARAHLSRPSMPLRPHQSRRQASQFIQNSILKPPLLGDHSALKQNIHNSNTKSPSMPLRPHQSTSQQQPTSEHAYSITPFMWDLVFYPIIYKNKPVIHDNASNNNSSSSSSNETDKKNGDEKNKSGDRRKASTQSKRNFLDTQLASNAHARIRADLNTIDTQDYEGGFDVIITNPPWDKVIKFEKGQTFCKKYDQLQKQSRAQKTDLK